jgi:hypothetical protein
MPDQGVAAFPTALLAVAISRPKNWARLDGLDEQAAQFVRLFQRHPDVTFTEPAQKLQRGGVADRVRQHFRLWKAAAAVEKCPYALVYWAGHGSPDGGEFYLITNDTPPPQMGLDPLQEIKATDLGKSLMMSRFERITVIIDACHSKGAALDIVSAVINTWRSATSDAVRSRVISVFAACETNEQAKKGAFTKVLLEALETPPPDGEWDSGDRFIDPAKLMKVINERWRDDSQRPELLALTSSVVDCIPNPRYVENPIPHTIDEESRAHFITRARGIDVGELGWFFTGRISILRWIVRWLAGGKSGMLVLTGSAGTGKSAILGRIATLSDPDVRAEAKKARVLEKAPSGTIPRQGVISVSVQAKNLSVDECARKIAIGLQLGKQVVTADQLVEALRNDPHRRTIVVDALDEAAVGHDLLIAQVLLAQVARLPGKRVIVGIRKTGVHGSSQSAALQLFQGSLGPDDFRDLDNIPKSEVLGEIQEYVYSRLTEAESSPYRGRPDDLAERVARAIAVQAEGVFLFARIVTKTVISRADVIEPDMESLPHDVESAFEDDLARFENTPEVWDMLAALAFAQGSGLPRQHWPAIAMEVRASERRASIPNQFREQYDDETVKRVLALAGSYVTRTSDSGQTVYRLYHQKLGEYFQNRLR